MHIHAIELILIVGFAILAMWVNGMLVKDAIINKVIYVVIIVAAIVMVLQSLGIIGGGNVTASLN